MVVTGAVADIETSVGAAYIDAPIYYILVDGVSISTSETSLRRWQWWYSLEETFCGSSICVEATDESSTAGL